MEFIYRITRVMWSSRVLRAATSGLAGVVVQTAIFEVAGIWLNLVAPSSAVILGAELGILTNFFIANRIAFGDAPQSRLWHRLVKFHIVILGSLVIQWVCVHWAETITSNVWALNAAFAAGVIIGFAANYTGYRLWVWRRQPTPNTQP